MTSNGVVRREERVARTGNEDLAPRTFNLWEGSELSSSSVGLLAFRVFVSDVFFISAERCFVDFKQQYFSHNIGRAPQVLDLLFLVQYLGNNL